MRIRSRYAVKMGRPMIFGATSQNERMLWLQEFKAGGRYNTIFISKVKSRHVKNPSATARLQAQGHVLSPLCHRLLLITGWRHLNRYS